MDRNTNENSQACKTPSYESITSDISIAHTENNLSTLEETITQQTQLMFEERNTQDK